MTCEELTAFLMDYLDGLLPEPARITFEEHLAECPDCVAYLAAYQKAILLGKAAYWSYNDAHPTVVPEDLVQAVLAARQR